MDFLSYQETGHIGGPSGKGHIRALDIGGIRRYRELSYIYCKIHSFYICDTGASPMHVSGHHISKAVSVQNLSKSISP